MMKKAVAISLAVAGAMGENPVIHPPQIVPNGWQQSGENADVTGRMDVLVGLRRSNKDKMQKVFEESSTPGNPHFLEHASWKEMGDIVRPSEEAIGATIGMLASKGATDISVANHGDYIKASVPMQGLEELTEGTFAKFKQAATGRFLTRLTGGVKLPAAVAKHVETFTGLHGFPLDAKPLVGNTTAGSVVTPSVINKAYGIDQQTVKKSGKTNIQAIGQFQGQYVSTTDLSKFCQAYDATADCSIAKFVGANTASKPGIESMLDTEYITGVAEGVTTWVYSYPSVDFCSDLLTWAGDVAAESEHPYVVSLSYGSQKIDFCDSTTRTRLSEDVQKLGAMGVTVVIASGDDGSGGMSRQGSNNGKLSPSFPASIPYALAVGATFFESGLSGEEQATTQFGSGGGFSYDYDAPSYQTDVIKAYLAKNPKTGSKTYATNGRGSPDVSLLGEQFEVYTSSPFGGLEKVAVGGTSASTPSWGAIISLLNEECLSASGGSKKLGFVNPLLYKNADAFNDITKGSNAIGENAASGWKCTEGWDAATGLGTPKFTSLQTVVRKACGSSTKESTVVV
jgi:tripeptidyl-peptidase-1